MQTISIHLCSFTYFNFKHLHHFQFIKTRNKTLFKSILQTEQIVVLSGFSFINFFKFVSIQPFTNACI